MSWALYVIAALEVAGGLFTVGRVGKPRKAITGGDAAYVVAVAAFIATVCVLAAMRL